MYVKSFYRWAKNNFEIQLFTEVALTEASGLKFFLTNLNYVNFIF